LKPDFSYADNADTELEVLISALKTAAAATDELDSKFSTKPIDTDSKPEYDETQVQEQEIKYEEQEEDIDDETGGIVKEEFAVSGEDEDSMDAMPLDVPDFSLISSILAGLFNNLEFWE
jgi:hypothetical protein